MNKQQRVPPSYNRYQKNRCQSDQFHCESLRCRFDIRHSNVATLLRLPKGFRFSFSSFSNSFSHKGGEKNSAIFFFHQWGDFGLNTLCEPPAKMFVVIENVWWWWKHWGVLNKCNEIRRNFTFLNTVSKIGEGLGRNGKWNELGFFLQGFEWKYQSYLIFMWHVFSLKLESNSYSLEYFSIQISKFNKGELFNCLKIDQNYATINIIIKILLIFFSKISIFWFDHEDLDHYDFIFTIIYKIQNDYQTFKIYRWKI